MQRREFITLVGGTAMAWPFAARAQQAGRKRLQGLIKRHDGSNQVRYAGDCRFRKVALSFRATTINSKLQAYKASADADTDWRWAYAGIAGLIGPIVGLTAFLFIRRKKVGVESPTSVN